MLLAATHLVAGTGDCDGDCDVDLADFAEFQLCFSGPGASAGPGCACADFDDDGDVDLTDFNSFQLSFTGPGVPSNIAELAGNPLDAFPFFEYVRAFNADAPVSIAIEASVHPALVGQTCDAYVVESKTAGEWQADASLTDVSGAVESVTISAGNIQGNTFTVAPAGALSSFAGIGIGHPYDVVLDCNRNGMLDDGDLLDGICEPGLFVVHDLTMPGPLAVTELDSYSVTGISTSFPFENSFYPTDIAKMGELPLIVVSHGHGHVYIWYDHLGTHMASYGFVLMSHQNNTGPGPFAASTTTLEHTDAFIGQIGTIGGGAIEGHIDTHRIARIGHSRGGEGVVLAYRRVFAGTYTPIHYDADDIILVSSIAPTDFNSELSTYPNNVNYHVWVGAADADVNGCCGCSQCQPFAIHDRATDFRQAISVYGAGHADFHNGGGSSVAQGPCLIGRPTTHQIMRGYFLPLVKYYAEGNLPAKDFLWRQWEHFKPIGAPTGTCVNINFMYRDGQDAGNVKIDDYQTEFANSISSSGGSVAFNVSALTEDRLDDSNTTFTDVVGDPMNGMTVGIAGDDTRGVVFEWTGNQFYEQEVIPALSDFSDGTYLSFRAAQVTQDMLTTMELADLTFTVTLRDQDGTTSSIEIGAYGGGLEEPYQRVGTGFAFCGPNPGWSNEFETIRIRLTDFLHNGSGLDLTRIEAIRFEFGPTFGSSVGRIGLDEIEITTD